MEKTKHMGWNLDNSYTRLPEIFYTTPEPTPAENPRLLFVNQPLAESLGLDADALQTEKGIQMLAGNEHPHRDGEYIAQAYAGHQFGFFTNLGDGRAIMLGEQLTPDDERYDIQLKGAGKTVYSRGNDGMAPLKPVLREYLLSEAMHGLGIPTTRALAAIKTDDTVFRGVANARGILTRVASSHLRVGTFQYAASRGDEEALRELADYAIDRHYPSLREAASPYLSLLEAVMQRQASLISRWQLAGFIHGVMNTDNMTISGETIDYGPCAFMNTFDIDTFFSSIDTQGRYRYGHQPAIAGWNLARFAETLLPLIDTDQDVAVQKAEEVVQRFYPLFNAYWLDGMRRKLGLFDAEEADFQLCSDLLDVMSSYEADYTDTFLALTDGQFGEVLLFKTKEFAEWYERWQERLYRQDRSLDEARNLMRRHNPALIPRNHLVEEVLDAAVENDDLQPMQRLLQALTDPYAHTAEQAAFNRQPVPDGPFKTFCGT